MSRVDIAKACFAQGCSCSQSVLAAFAPEFGMDRETALRIASAFGGGIARSGSLCGAASGALMVIGLKYGSSQPDRVAKERTYELGRTFLERFRSRNGAVDCRDLLGYDFNTPEGREAIHALRLTHNICPALVESAVEILEEMVGTAY